jgi:hypothetical protein
MSIYSVQLTSPLNALEPSLGPFLLLAVLPSQEGGAGQPGPKGQSGAACNYREQTLDLKKVPVKPVATPPSIPRPPCHDGHHGLSSGLQLPTKRIGSILPCRGSSVPQLTKARNGPRACPTASSSKSRVSGAPQCLGRGVYHSSGGRQAFCKLAVPGAVQCGGSALKCSPYAWAFPSVL